jgi:hypothetical protein
MSRSITNTLVSSAGAGREPSSPSRRRADAGRSGHDVGHGSPSRIGEPRRGSEVLCGRAVVVEALRGTTEAPTGQGTDSAGRRATTPERAVVNHDPGYRQSGPGLISTPVLYPHEEHLYLPDNPLRV